jgi:hypothetical protein
MRFRLIIGLLSALSLSQGPLTGQVIAVHFKDQKAAKKYKHNLTEYRGEMVVIGEPKQGIVYQREKNNLTFVPNGSNQIFVVNPKQPEKHAYFLVEGKKVEASKKNRLTIQGHHIQKLTLLMPDETLPGLAKEYNIRSIQIEHYQGLRDAQEPGTRSWQAEHVRVITSMERLRVWLLNTGYPGALRDLDKRIKKQNRQVRGESLRLRGEQARSSVEAMDIPLRLEELSQEISGGEHVFRAHQSQHLCIYYIDTISEAEAAAALLLGEEIIEGFRAEFVDPYLDEAYEDFIPDGRFHEFLFVPNNVEHFKRYASGFWRVRWEQDQQVMKGGRTTGPMPGPGMRDYWRTEEIDLQGIICHALGHSLASLHYGQGSMHLTQDWLSEALGYYISFDHLGRNSVTCFAFNREKAGYVKRERKAKKKGEKTVVEGRRDIYNEVALKEGRKIDQIALKTLFELEDADLAKSWSFFDFVARKEAKAGQQWLRAAGRYSSSRSTFIAKWRAAAADILGVSPAEAFRSIEERWRAYAQSEQ